MDTTNTGRMQRDTELLAIHHTALVTWVLRQLGAAVLIATIIGAFFVAGMGPSGVLVGALAFGLMLLIGSAPKPPSPGA